MTQSIFLTAGEASGDNLGAGLIHALKEIHPDTAFTGVGGSLMARQGLQSLFPMSDLSVMGLAEVLPRLPLLMRRIDETAQAVIETKPDIFISIDSPDFSFRVARKIRKLSERPPIMIHYVAPTVWAWRPERAAKLAQMYDGVICLFPFEPPYFEAEGMKAAFVGHPAVDAPEGVLLRSRLAIPEGAPVLGFFPGSRHGEIKRTGKILAEAVKKFSNELMDLYVVCLTLPHLEQEVSALFDGCSCKTHILTDQHLKPDIFATLDAAVATSGTIGLELALAGVPHLIAYKMNPLTFRIIRRKVKVKYAHLANILLDAPVVPEFIQDACKAEGIAAAALQLLPSLEKGRVGGGEIQKQAFTRVRSILQSPGDGASHQAAAFVGKCLAAIKAPV